MPLPQMRTQSRFHMELKTIERLAAIAVMKVSDPAPEGGVDIFDYQATRGDQGDQCQVFYFGVASSLVPDW